MIKNKQPLSFISLMLFSSATVVFADTATTTAATSSTTIRTTAQPGSSEKTSPATVSAHAALMSSKKDNDPNAPLWNKEQARQAALEKKYKDAIAADPENKKNYAYLAGVYLANNKSSKAIDAYQEAIMHDPENPKLFAALSIAYLHQSKFGMAKAMADQALKIDPSLKSVNKINDYIVAKKAVVDAASKVPAGGKIPDMSRFDTGSGHGKKTSHGALRSPGATVEKPKNTSHQNVN